jgi:type III secretion protein U
MGEKTEKATPKKLRDARKKGQVAKSQDFPSAMTFIAAIGMTMYLANFLYMELGGMMINYLKMAPNINVPQTIPFFRDQIIRTILVTSLPVAGFVAVVGIIVNFLVIGPCFSTEVFKPNMKKFNVVENLKQKFKIKTLVELIKSLLKIIGAAFLIYLIARGHVRDLIITPMTTPEACAVIFAKIMFKVMIAIGIYFLIIAVADLAYQKYNFAKEMKMEKFEVKQEYKDTEGNPEIKGKRRQIAQEIAYDSGSGQVRRAKAVVTNPDDAAIAIGYEPKKYKAPWIIDKGSGIKAQMIIREAEKYDVPIMRNVPLAHQLLEEGQVHKFIPESAYEAVGEILLYIASLKAEEGTAEEEEENI